MARATERPPKIESEADDLIEIDTNDGWHDVEGEALDTSTTQVLTLAHRVAAKFPHLSKRYQSYAGPAVIVSGALIALAGVAVARRMRRGQKPEEILEQITPEEIEAAAGATSSRNAVVRMVKRVAERRSKNAASSDNAPEA